MAGGVIPQFAPLQTRTFKAIGDILKGQVVQDDGDSIHCIVLSDLTQLPAGIALNDAPDGFPVVVCTLGPALTTNSSADVIFSGKPVEAEVNGGYTEPAVAGNGYIVGYALASYGPGEWVQVFVNPGIGAPGSAGALPNFADNEVPTPVPDGVATVFTLAHAPDPPDSLQLFSSVNAFTTPVYSLCKKDAPVSVNNKLEYTLSGDTITFVSPPAASPTQQLTAFYRWTV